MIYFNNLNCVGQERRRRSPFLYFDHDETSLEDDEMGAINFKTSNCLDQEFGKSMKMNIAILHLDDDETGLDDDETGKIRFKNSN